MILPIWSRHSTTTKERENSKYDLIEEYHDSLKNDMYYDWNFFFMFKLKGLVFKEILPDVFQSIAEDNQNKRVHFAQGHEEETVEYLNGELRHREDMIELFQADLSHVRYQYDLLLNDVSIESKSSFIEIQDWV